MVSRPSSICSLICGLFLAGCLFLPAAGQVQAADKSAADKAEQLTVILHGDESPDAMQKVMSAAEKAGRPVTIRLSAPEEKPAVAAADPAAPANTFDVVVATIVNGFAASTRTIPAVAQLPEDWSKAWAEVRNGEQGTPPLVRLLGVLAVGLLAGVIAKALMRKWVAKHRVPLDPSISRRFLASLAVALGDLLVLAAAVLAMRICIPYFLPEDDVVREIAHRSRIAVTGIGYYLIAARFLLAPNDPPRRLLPLPRDEFHYRMFAVYGGAVPILFGVTNVIGTFATNHDTVSGVFTIASCVVTAYKLTWFWIGRHDFQQLALTGMNAKPEHAKLLHRMLAFSAPYLLMFSAVGIWLVGTSGAVMKDGDAWGHAAGLTQWMVLVVPICAYGAGGVVACLLYHKLEERAVPSPLLTAAADTSRSLATGLIWITGIIVLIWIWGNLLLDMNASMQNGSVRQAIGIVTVAFCGWMAWRFLKNLFAAITPPPMVTTVPAITDEDTPHEEYVPSRLATVLPAVRGVALACIIGVTLLIALSKLGIDINPLVAGFGIMGLAVSFGSQALVRDIVSGFFFIMEDAFRVGEYVDTGKLKGTVEKISLRSMQLRHQSGLVHVVPFGQLTSVTNASRDWATVKFNLRLDHSADIEKARKTIKRIGVGMLDDPEFGKDIIAPLKMQGVSEISENAIVVRLKFTSKPEHASAVQRLALRRVHDGLIEAGVPFASNQVVVRGSDNPHAAAAYAAQAALRPAAE